jgi:hypothetical protein
MPAVEDVCVFSRYVFLDVCVYVWMNKCVIMYADKRLLWRMPSYIFGTSFCMCVYMYGLTYIFGTSFCMYVYMYGLTDAWLSVHIFGMSNV